MKRKNNLHLHFEFFVSQVFRNVLSTISLHNIWTTTSCTMLVSQRLDLKCGEHRWINDSCIPNRESLAPVHILQLTSMHRHRSGMQPSLLQLRSVPYIEVLLISQVTLLLQYSTMILHVPLVHLMYFCYQMLTRYLFPNLDQVVYLQPLTRYFIL